MPLILAAAEPIDSIYRSVSTYPQLLPTSLAGNPRAATYGLVDTVLVDIDEVVPGEVDEETGAITLDEADDAADYGVVDEIARRVWLSGGTVLAVRRGDIPGNASVAAILRYAP